MRSRQMIAVEMQTMRKEMEQEFAAKLNKVYDEVRIERKKRSRNDHADAKSVLTWLGFESVVLFPS